MYEYLERFLWDLSCGMKTKFGGIKERISDTFVSKISDSGISIVPLKIEALLLYWFSDCRLSMDAWSAFAWESWRLSYSVKLVL